MQGTGIIDEHLNWNFGKGHLVILGDMFDRGYFYDPGFCEKTIDGILDFYGVKHVVVGHTPNTTIISLFHNKILGTDTGICDGRSGEILIYKEGDFYQSLSTGRRNKL